jgi:hypothetical protein
MGPALRCSPVWCWFQINRDGVAAIPRRPSGYGGQARPSEKVAVRAVAPGSPNPSGPSWWLRVVAWLPAGVGTRDCNLGRVGVGCGFQF